MSVYTLLNESQLKEVLALYGINTLSRYQEIHDGIENSNYLITCLEQDYVLTLFEHQSPEVLAPFLTFMADALGEGFPVPAPLENIQGEPLSFFMHQGQRRHCILCPRLPGVHPSSADSELCHHIGTVFAHLHCTFSQPSYTQSFPEQSLDTIIPKIETHRVPELLTTEKQKLYQDELIYIERALQNFPKLATGICHCDFFPDNVLITHIDNKTQISALLDWYDAKHTLLIYDLAVLCLSWASFFNCHSSQVVDNNIMAKILKSAKLPTVNT